jgi:hypothetical protein
LVFFFSSSGNRTMGLCLQKKTYSVSSQWPDSCCLHVELIVGRANTCQIQILAKKPKALRLVLGSR